MPAPASLLSDRAVGEARRPADRLHGTAPGYNRREKCRRLKSVNFARVAPAFSADFRFLPSFISVGIHGGKSRARTSATSLDDARIRTNNSRELERKRAEPIP
jgi:hypothetical protein